MKSDPVDNNSGQPSANDAPTPENDQDKNSVGEEGVTDGQTEEQKIHTNFYQLPAALQTDFEAIEQKPWNEVGADISDYFNYGFDEEMFTIYQNKVKENFRDLNRDMLQQEVNTNGLEIEHTQLNFHLPHEAGG
jgi:hypothetical protein